MSFCPWQHHLQQQTTFSVESFFPSEGDDSDSVSVTAKPVIKFTSGVDNIESVSADDYSTRSGH